MLPSPHRLYPASRRSTRAETSRGRAHEWRHRPPPSTESPSARLLDNLSVGIANLDRQVQLLQLRLDLGAVANSNDDESLRNKILFRRGQRLFRGDRVDALGIRRVIVQAEIVGVDVGQARCGVRARLERARQR